MSALQLKSQSAYSRMLEVSARTRVRTRWLRAGAVLWGAAGLVWLFLMSPWGGRHMSSAVTLSLVELLALGGIVLGFLACLAYRGRAPIAAQREQLGQTDSRRQKAWSIRSSTEDQAALLRSMQSRPTQEQ